MEAVRQEIQSHSDIAQQIESEARRVQGLWGFWKYERRGELVSPGYWHGTSAKQIAKKIGWQLSYDLVYAQASLLTHTSARSANDYIRRVSRDDHVLLDAAPSEHYVETVLGTAALYLHGIAADWCEILKVPSSMRERLKEVEGEWPKKSPPREEPELESQGKM